MYIEEFIKSTEVKEMLQLVRQAVANDTELRKHSDELCHLLYEKRDKHAFLNELANKQEALESRLGELNRVFTLYVYDRGLNDLVEFYKTRKISENIMFNTFNDLNIWIGNYFNEHGVYGFNEDVWLVHHILGDIFSLGRLQFAFSKYQPHTEVYKNGDSTLVAAIKDLPLTKDGEYASADNTYIRTKYEKPNEQVLLAHLVNIETGIVDLVPTSIDLTKYKLVLKHGDDILAVHIPANGRMDYAECLKSFEQAKAFFPEHFPQFGFKAFTCDSWLLSNEIKGLVPEGSNISNFSSLYTRYISKGTGPMIYKWIFGFDCKDALKANPASSLAKNVQKLLISGGEIFSRGGFILR